MMREIPRIPHDALFKELLRRFLPEVMGLFLPQEAALLRWETMTFIDKEVATNLPESLKRIADVVAEVERVDGQPEVILLHVEVEASRKTEMPARMFEYYALLRLLKERLVLPVVMMLMPVGDEAIRLQRYREEIGGQVYMELAYWQINLRDLAGDAYAARLEPVAAALSAVMPMVDPVAARLASWRTIVGSQGLTEKEKSFLIYFTDVYRPLAALESIGEDVMSELNLMQEPYVFDPYEIGLRQGLEQGLERGEVNGLRRAVGQVLVERFGEVDEVWWERLAGINDEGLLLGLLRDVWRAEGVADLVWEAEGE